MDYKAIGKRIRVLRKHKKLTQAELAKQANISTSFLGHIERGTRIASLETLHALSKELHASLDALVDGMDHFETDSSLITLHSVKQMHIMEDMVRVLKEHRDEWLHVDDMV